MKNFDLLPLDEIQMQRVKKFAEMHHRYGGIIIDVIAYDNKANVALIQVKDKRHELTNEQLYQKASEVFEGEKPAGMGIFFTMMDEADSKFYVTWDHGFIIRVHKYFLVWQIAEKGKRDIDLRPAFAFTNKDHMDKTAADTEKAMKWYKNYLIEHTFKPRRLGSRKPDMDSNSHTSNSKA